MKFSVVESIRNRIASLSDTARLAGAAIAGFVLCEVGTRISAPHLNGQALGDWLRRTEPGGLLGLYDRLVGGALSRGAVLALGIMPYLSARIFMRIARGLHPVIGAMHRDATGRRKLTRATRWLTFGLSLIQSYGFARFALGVPGAVTDPGTGFIAETMVVLTAGALVVMTLAEQFAGDTGDVASESAELRLNARETAHGGPSLDTLTSHPSAPLLTDAVDAAAVGVQAQSAAQAPIRR